MDLLMPVCDGFSAVNQIMDILRKEYKSKRSLPGKNNPVWAQKIDAMRPEQIAFEMGVSIPAVTAYLDQPTVDKVFEHGMIEAIQKPVKSSQMDFLIEKYYVYGNKARLN